MARNYPRFLYSNPQNTKSKGPFIVHLLDPRLVFSIVFTEEECANAKTYKWAGPIGLILLDKIKGDKKIEEIMSEAVSWLKHQIEQGAIDITMEHLLAAHLNWKNFWVKKDPE